MKEYRIYGCFTLLFLSLVFTLPVSVEQNEIDGERLYKKHCKSCHGRKGGLGLKGATNLKKIDITMEQRITSIREGKGIMTPFKNVLEEEEIIAIAKYSETLKK